MERIDVHRRSPLSCLSRDLVRRWRICQVCSHHLREDFNELILFLGSFIATPLLVHWTTVDRLYGSPVGASLICGIYSVGDAYRLLILPLM